MNQTTKGAWLKAIGAVLSGLLLFASFSPLEWRDAAWVALVPLLLAVFLSRPDKSFRLGFLTGIVFWLLTICWILRLGVTGCSWWLAGIGWLLLSGCFALYVAAFAAIVGRYLNPLASDSRLRHVACALGIALVWVGIEYLRSHLFTGFPWNTLGVSQFTNLSVIQVAEFGGVYAVSFLVVLLNAAIAVSVTRHLKPAPPVRRLIMHPELALAIALLLAAMAWGCKTARRWRRVCYDGNVAIAVVQPNIPQIKKWSSEYIEWIYGQLKQQTDLAVAAKPDLVVWPETAVPDYARTEPTCREFISSFLGKGVPILVGSMDYTGAGENTKLYNSSLLFDSSGLVRESYAKRHLVPFGEYVPLEGVFPVLRRLAPQDWSCAPGSTNTVFRLKTAGSGQPINHQPSAIESGAEITFSVLICFEDIFPSLARQSVRNGAKLLINQTNDAWFDPKDPADRSWASRQHMSHCVFRCVENRVCAVRAANTGISCFINMAGDITDMLSVNGAHSVISGNTSVQGFLLSRVFVPPGKPVLTLYARYGDLLCGIPCAVAVFLFLLVAGMERVKNMRRLQNH